MEQAINSDNKQQMRGADAILKVLSAHGISTLFGYPGGTVMPIYDALCDSEIEHVLSRHEQGAAFAAVGYARASGKTGVCLATSGPGVTNLITALADAYSDSVPLVAITGQVSRAMMGTDAFQEIDTLGLSLACTKHSFLVEHSEDLVPILYQAFELAAEGRPGPVLVDIPKDIQLAMVNYRRPLQGVESQQDFTQVNASIEQARILLSKAKRPILYAGGGIAMACAVDKLQAFINQTQIPSVSTLKGLGCIAPNTPYYLGMLGMHGLKAANLAVQSCDLLLVVGARFDDRVTGKLAEFAPSAKVIHLDIDAAELGKLRQPEVTIEAELGSVLAQLAMPLDIADWQQQITALNELHQWNYDQACKAAGHKIYAPAMLRNLSLKLPEDSVVSCDVGQHQMWVAQHMQFTRPENHLSSSGLGSMGFGLPAAIGAQCARVGAKVVCVSGDGSFMMNVQELATIKRKKLPIKILLLDNQKLGMVKQWQQLFFDSRYSETDLSDNPDFLTLAAAFNIPSRSIFNASDIDQGLDELLNHDGPFLLHVAIDDSFNVWPLVPPGCANHQMIDQQPSIMGERK